MAHAGYIADFGNQDRVKVLTWLMTYVMDENWQMSANNTSCIQSGVGARPVYRWRMALRKNDNRVLFDNLDDLQLFVLAWPSKVIDLGAERK